MFPFAGHHGLDRSARFFGKISRNNAEVASAIFRTEAATHKLADDPDLTFRHIKNRGKFVPDTFGRLRGCVDGHHIGFPVYHTAVRLKRTVGLYLGAEGALDDYIGLRKTFFNIALRSPIKTFRSRAPHLSLIHISEPTRRTPIS